MSMDITEVLALSKPMEILLQEPGVHLPQLVVCTMSHPPISRSSQREKLNISCLLLSISFVFISHDYLKHRGILDSTGILSWISHYAINSLNGSGTCSDFFKRSCIVLVGFSSSFGTDFNGAGTQI